MVSFNQVVLAGNLTRDPELRYVPSGKAVTKFGLAVNRSYITSTGERKDEVDFIPIVVWGKQAETCNQYLQKGRSVLVSGRLQFRSWETESGEKRSILEVVAQRVQFLGRREDAYGPQESLEEPQIEREVVDEVPF